jgi:hypothetical protein
MPEEKRPSDNELMAALKRVNGRTVFYQAGEIGAIELYQLTTLLGLALSHPEVDAANALIGPRVFDLAVGALSILDPVLGAALRAEREKDVTEITLVNLFELHS